jgi:hypothetical protein
MTSKSKDEQKQRRAKAKTSKSKDEQKQRPRFGGARSLLEAEVFG